MIKNTVDTLVGVAIIVTALVICLHWYTKLGVQHNRGYYKLTADFTDISGLDIGSEVRLSGIPIGYVNRYYIDSSSYMAHVDLLINNSVRIPSDSMVSVSNDSLFGRKYLKIIPGSDKDLLEHDDILLLTQPSITLDSIINAFLAMRGGDGS